MLFLIVYSRRNQELLAFTTYQDSEEEVAQKDRLSAELAADHDQVEALLLRAGSEAAVRSSHARYFQDASSLLEGLRNSA